MAHIAVADVIDLLPFLLILLILLILLHRHSGYLPLRSRGDEKFFPGWRRMLLPSAGFTYSAAIL